MRTLNLLYLAMATLLVTSCARGGREGVVNETYVHKYGLKVPEEDWHSRGQHGFVITKMNDGTSVKKSYSGGVLDGETAYSFPHQDKVERIEFYEMGTLIKEQINYHTGVPKKEIIYVSPEEIYVTMWYENGSPKGKEKIRDRKLIDAEYFSIENQPESHIVGGRGTRVTRDQYGQMTSHDSFESGELTERMTYHLNGALKEIIPYVDGKIEGEKKTYYPTGEPHTIECWMNNKQHGITIEYQNGEKYAEIPYVNDQKHGIERRFCNETELIEAINWKNGERHGPSYNIVDDVKTAHWFYKDREVTKPQYDRFTRTRVH